MATQVYKDCKVYLGEKDISADLNNVAISDGAEMQDDTTMGDDTRSNKAGLKTVGVAIEGFVQADTDLVEDTIWDKFAAVDEVLTMCPETGADGEVAFVLKSVIANYNPGGSVGDMYAFTVDANATGDLYKGTIMATGVETATGTGVARQLGAVGATEKVYAALHVLEATAVSTLDVIIQSDDAVGFPAPDDEITFVQATAAGTQLLSADGAITNDYWRVSWTIGGAAPSFTFVVVIWIV